MDNRTRSAWALSVVAALALGWWLGREPDAEVSSSADMRDAMREALARPDSVQRYGRVTALIPQVDADNLPGAIEAFEETLITSPVAAETHALRLFASHWASLDADGMLERSARWRNPSHQRIASAEALRRRVRTHGMQGATEFWRSLPSGQREQLVGILMWEWVHTEDWNGMAEFLAALPIHETRSNANKIVLGTLNLWGGDEAVIRWADSVPADARGDYRNWVLSTALRQVGRHDPRRGVQWLEDMRGRIPDSTIHALTISLAATWGEIDGASAVQWAGGLPDPPREKALSQAALRWVETKSEEAERWLEMQEPSKPLDAANHSIALRSGPIVEDPLRSLFWAERVTQEGLRFRATRAIGQAWIQADAEEARAWLANSGLPEAWIAEIQSNRISKTRKPPQS